MKVKIEVEIESCANCPFVKMEKVYTGDSWEDVQKWMCTKENNEEFYDN